MFTFPTITKAGRVLVVTTVSGVLLTMAPATASASADAAASWAATMARSGRLAHNPNLAGSVSGWKYLGENVGVGDTVASLESAFYSSTLRQLHRAFAARHQGWAPSLLADALPHGTREVTAP